MIEMNERPIEIAGLRPATGKSRGIPLEVAARRDARMRDLGESLCQALPPDGAITLEFGCGHGHWLTGYAEAHPDRFCLGIDLLSARVRKAEAKRVRRALTNLLFLKADARELLAVWPTDRSIAEVFMLFPDPWPKKRHYKNRMVQSDFLSRLAAHMGSGARFHFRTDHDGYLAWSRDLVKEHPDWELTTDRWPWEAPTFFQAMMDSWDSLIASRVSPHPEDEGKFDDQRDPYQDDREPQKRIHCHLSGGG